MAKSKSSQQVNISESKTGIDMTLGLGFESKGNVDKKDAQKSVVEKTINKPSIKENKGFVTTAPSVTSTSKKLKKPDKINFDAKTYKISAVISEQAMENLEKYSKAYGFKKLSPFINELFENLDAYMD